MTSAEQAIERIQAVFRRVRTTCGLCAGLKWRFAGRSVLWPDGEVRALDLCTECDGSGEVWALVWRGPAEDDAQDDAI